MRHRARYARVRVRPRAARRRPKSLGLAPMRVVLADPPAYTPPYDHALAAALARQGVDVRLLTSPFRFGARAGADGFAVDDSLYRALDPVGSPRGSPRGQGARAPARARAARAAPTATSLHLQWVAAPEADVAAAAHAAPLVFTAHDLLPRRTARHTRTWKRLFRPLRPHRHPQRARPPRRSRRSASPRASSASSPTPPSAAIRPAPTTAAPCSRSG